MSAVRENWVRMALQYLRVYCMNNVRIWFTCEDVADQLEEDGYPWPSDRRWWGFVFQQAQDECVIRRTQLTRRVRSRHQQPVWRAR